MEYSVNRETDKRDIRLIGTGKRDIRLIGRRINGIFC